MTDTECTALFNKCLKPTIMDDINKRAFKTITIDRKVLPSPQDYKEMREWLFKNKTIGWNRHYNCFIVEELDYDTLYKATVAKEDEMIKEFLARKNEKK